MHLNISYNGLKRLLLISTGLSGCIILTLNTKPYIFIFRYLFVNNWYTLEK